MPLRKLWGAGILLAAMLASRGAGQPIALYHVAPEGDDAGGDGSAARPWATIAGAAAALPDSGGVVLVADGVYTAGIRIARAFASPAVFRARNAYRAVLEPPDTVAIEQAANVEFADFEMRPGGRGPDAVLLRIEDSSNVVVRNSILHDASGGGLVRVAGASRHVLLAGNLLSHSSLGRRHIEVDGSAEVAIRENILLIRPEAGGSAGEDRAYIAVRNPAWYPESGRIAIAANIFVAAEGRPGSFIRIGGDDQPVYSAQDVVIENNLAIGSSHSMQAALSVQGVRDVLVRNNTVSAALPGAVFAAALGRHTRNPRNRGVRFLNNLWSDARGGMTRLAECARADCVDTVLDNNLYWNGGTPVPEGETALGPAADPRASVTDPMLSQPEEIVVPVWTGSGFASGSGAIREEFRRLVEWYGTPDAASPAIGRADAAAAPAGDILGRQRNRAAPDLGAAERSAASAPLRILPAAERMAGGTANALNQVVLETPAGPEGVTVALESSDPAASVPPAVTVAPGAAAAAFTISTSAVESPATVLLTASTGEASASATLTVTPRRLRALNLAPDVVVGGASTARNVVLLDGAAPARGLRLALASSHPDLARMAPEITIPAGSSASDYFVIETRPVAEPVTVAITAASGAWTAGAHLELLPEEPETPPPPPLAGAPVAGVTATQAVIRYTPPGTEACRVLVSESERFGDGYQPVHDVNPALFPGADQDSRSGTFLSGAARHLVIGKRTVEKAADGKRYSRALANNTTHYFRIECAGAAFAGSFQTGNIPFGSTYAETLPSDPSGNDGLYNYPSLNWSDRAEKVVDHLTGTEIRKVTLPAEFSEGAVNQAAGECAGNGWTRAEKCGRADGDAATYSGSGQALLFVPTPYRPANGTNLLNRLNLQLRAAISGSPSGDDRYLDICITKDGATCAGPWKGVDLTTCSLESYAGDCADTGSAEDMDAWTGAALHGWVTAPLRGVLIRPRTTNPDHTIAIDAIRYTCKSMGVSVRFPAHAGMPLCSMVPITDDGDGHTYYLCHTIGANRMYSIDVTDGRAYYLGPIYGFARTITELAWDQENGRVFYGVHPDNRLLRGTWSPAPGAMRAEHTGSFLAQPDNLHWTDMTPAGYTLKDLLAAFDARFDAEWQSYTRTSRFTIVTTQNGKIVLGLQTAQDRGGWVAAFDPAAPPPEGSRGRGNIVAAYPVGLTGPSRFCGIHTLIGDNSDQPWIVIGNGRLARGTGYFAGPWQVKVRKPGGGALMPDDAVFELVEFQGGYEPADPTPSGGAHDRTLPAQPGDLFYYDANGNGVVDSLDELVEIVSVDRGAAPPRWTVRRGSQLDGSPFMPAGFRSAHRTVLSLADGAVLEGVCRSKPLNRDNDNGSTYWNFAADPHGETLVHPAENGEGTYPPEPGIYGKDSGYASPQVYVYWNYGSHGHVHLARGVKVAFAGPPDCQPMHGNNVCWAVQAGSGVNLINSPVAYQSAVIPPFSGALPPGGSNTYQSHPGYLQANAGPAEQRWAFDVMPFSNGAGVYGSTGEAEPGAAHVYKVTGATLHRKHLGTLATCGERILHDISAPERGNRITDQTPYTYCVANAAGECREGSAAGDVYVSCPGRTTRGCAGAPFSATYPTTVVDVCVGDSWAFGHGIVQVPLTANSVNGERTRVIAYPFPIPHLQNVYASAKAMPDGRWALYLANRHERADVFLIKVPPYPEPEPPEKTVDRAHFVRLPVSVPAPADGDRAALAFGYAENGEPAQFYCTTRKESCLAASAAVDPARPFQFASEAPAGVPCAGGCTIELPGISQRVLYYRVEYRDGSGNLRAEGPLQAVVVP